MDYSEPVNPLIPNIVGSGIVGLLITIGIVIVGFIISAFIASPWVRLILVFMRRALDREYDRAASGFRTVGPLKMGC